MSSENNNRKVFGLHGVTGMLIATVLLLSILASLTVWGISTQQSMVRKPYRLENIDSVKMRNPGLKLDDVRKDIK